METIIKTIKCNKKGKNVLIISGVHGDEITPIYTVAYMLKNNLFKTKYIKNLTIINGINISGIKKLTREVDYETSADLNRVLNNNKEQDYIRELTDNINKNDIIIDIHSSPSCTEFALIDIDEYTMSLKNWCDKSNVQCAFRYSGADTIKRYCLENNKPALTLEINMMKIIDFNSSFRTAKLINRLLDNIEKIKMLKTVPKVKELREIKTYNDGLLIHNFRNGGCFRKGQTLYKVFDLELNEINDVKSDCHGIVICEPDKSIVTRGDTVYFIQETD